MIIQNYDQINNKHQDKLDTLNRIYRDTKFPEDLYYKLKDTIVNNYDPADQQEISTFLQDLPYSTRVKTIMYIYKNQYESIDFLQDQN